jgi:trehalose 6-phosphate synthase
MTRLVVISNRVAEFDNQGEASKGGLAMALSAALRKHGGLWFGWSGRTGSVPSAKASVQHYAGIDVATLDLDEQDVEEYYNGFANRTLWPLCHYRSDLIVHERSFGAGYQRVNERFADMLMPLLRENDTLWVHDYHLIPLARATGSASFFIFPGQHGRSFRRCLGITSWCRRCSITTWSAFRRKAGLMPSVTM